MNAYPLLFPVCRQKVTSQNDQFHTFVIQKKLIDNITFSFFDGEVSDQWPGGVNKKLQMSEHGFYHAVTGEQVISYMHQHIIGSVIWPQTSVTSELIFSLSRETNKPQVQFWVLPFYSGTVGVSGLCRTVQNKLWVEVQTDLVADARHISLQGINGFPIDRKEEKTINTQSRWGNHLFNNCSDVQTACFSETAIKPASSPLRMKF